MATAAATDGVAAAPKRILVVGPAWIGDMVLAQSLYKSLKRRDAEVEIDVVAPAWSQALLKRMPEVSRAVEMPAGHGELKLGARLRLGRRLRERGYDQAIVLPRSLKAALLPWFAGVPVRTGFRGEMRYGLINDVRVLDEKAMPKIVTRFVFLGQPPETSPDDELETSAPALRVDSDNRDACLRRLGLETDAPVLGLMPGAAFGRSKQWPPEHFAEIARRYAGEGRRVWIFGSDADREIGERIRAASSSPGSPGSVSSATVNLCGRTTLGEAIDLMSLADFAVTNDSGLMHVAAAVGCPLVAVYGATTPAYTPPMTVRSKCLWLNLECSPCWSRTCRYGHYRCLTGVSPDAVREAVREVEEGNEAVLAARD